MIRRVCPICDQVMTGRHYCRICHSLVRHPRIQDVTYYLNERHPQNETACSYHDSYHDSVHRQEDSAGSKMKKSGTKDGTKGLSQSRKTTRNPPNPLTPSLLRVEITAVEVGTTGKRHLEIGQTNPRRRGAVARSALFPSF